MQKVVPTKPLFILLYGFPGAGKTYFARQLCEHLQAAHVHGDRIRAELFDKPQYDKEENGVVGHLMDYIAGEFLSSGLSVVYDVNAMRASQRRLLRDMARKHHATPLLVWFQIDMESAYARFTARDRRRSDDKFAGPGDQTTFERAAANMQNPQNEEYFVISGKHAFPTQLNAFMKRMRELTLIPHLAEVNTKLVKPGLVNLIPNPAAGRVDLSRRNIVIR